MDYDVNCDESALIKANALMEQNKLIFTAIIAPFVVHSKIK